MSDPRLTLSGHKRTSWRVPAIIAAAAVLLVVILAGVIWYGQSAHRVTITQAEYGAEWPFTVSEGTLRCEPTKKIVFMTASGSEYGVNSLARDDYALVDNILLPNPRDPSLKFPLGEIIDRGLALC